MKQLQRRIRRSVLDFKKMTAGIQVGEVGGGRKGAGEGKGMGDGYALQPRKRVMRGRRRLSGLGDVEQ